MWFLIFLLSTSLSFADDQFEKISETEFVYKKTYSVPVSLDLLEFQKSQQEEEIAQLQSEIARCEEIKAKIEESIAELKRQGGKKKSEVEEESLSGER